MSDDKKTDPTQDLADVISEFALMVPRVLLALKRLEQAGNTDEVGTMRTLLRSIVQSLLAEIGAAPAAIDASVPQSAIGETPKGSDRVSGNQKPNNGYDYLLLDMFRQREAADLPVSLDLLFKAAQKLYKWKTEKGWLDYVRSNRIEITELGKQERDQLLLDVRGDGNMEQVKTAMAVALGRPALD